MVLLALYLLNIHPFFYIKLPVSRKRARPKRRHVNVLIIDMEMVGERGRRRRQGNPETNTLLC